MLLVTCLPLPELFVIHIIRSVRVCRHNTANLRPLVSLAKRLTLVPVLMGVVAVEIDIFIMRKEISNIVA